MKMKHWNIIFMIAAAVLLLSFSYFSLFSKRGDIRIALNTVSGDKNILNDVKISGDILDSEHKISFYITGDKMEKQFQYGDYLNSYCMPDDRSMENFEKSEFYETANVCGRTVRYSIINNTAYIVLTNDINSPGKEGVYAIPQSGYLIHNPYDQSMDINDYNLEITANLLPADLRSSNVKIVNYTFTDDKIALFFTRDNNVFMDIFDTSIKQSLGDVKICDEAENSSYDSIESNGTIVLKQSINNNDCFYIIDPNKLTVIDTAIVNIGQDTEYIHKLLTKVLYKNNTFFILYDYEVEREMNQNYYKELFLNVYAFQNGQQLYEGTIDTDAAKDIDYTDLGQNGSLREYCNMRME